MVLGVLHYRKQIQSKSQLLDTSVKSIIDQIKDVLSLCSSVPLKNNIVSVILWVRVSGF